MMEKVEYLCTAFNSIKLKDLNERLQKATVSERPNVVSSTVVKHKEDEQAKHAVATEKATSEKAKAAVSSGGWSVEDVQLLTKGEKRQKIYQNLHYHPT